jgi:hypothetical protein
MSLVEAAIRRRADETVRCTPSSLPAGVNKWLPFLLQREWRIGMEVGTVAAGWDRSFFVDPTGALLACGKEEEREIGLLGLRDGTSQTSFTAVVPMPVPSMAGVRIRAVVCTEDCNLDLTEAGQLFAWGRHVPEEDTAWSKCLPPVPTVMEELRKHRVCQVAAGEFHCAAVTEDGALFTWLTGDEESGEPNEPFPLGYGRRAFDVGVPHRILAFEGVRIASAAVGAGFTVAVTEAGAVYSFAMADGRLGHGDRDYKVGVFRPKRIQALDGIHVAAVAAGDSHALALTRCGRVYSWGGYVSKLVCPGAVTAVTTAPSLVSANPRHRYRSAHVMLISHPVSLSDMVPTERRWVTDNHEAVSTTELERSFLRFASPPPCSPRTAAQPDKHAHAVQHAHRRRPLMAATPSL